MFVRNRKWFQSKQSSLHNLLHSVGKDALHAEDWRLEGDGGGAVVTLRRRVQAEVNVARTRVTLCEVCIGVTAVWVMAVAILRRVQTEVNVAHTWVTLCEVCIGVTAVWVTQWQFSEGSRLR